MRIKGLYVVRSGGLAAPVPTTRAEDDEAASDGSVMELRFSTFNSWYEINSFWEGRFLERTLPGAFKRTIKSLKRDDGNYAMKSLFNHGMDFSIGDKLLGTVSSLSEESDSPVALVDLYDEASYVRDLMPGLRAGDYGSSFMFEVLRDRWDHEPEPSDYNPEGLPERSIEEVRLYEAGPVTFPANPAATAGLRSGCHTDALIERMIERGLANERDTMAMFDAFRAAHKLPSRSAPAPEVPAPARHVGRSKSVRERELFLANMRGGK